MSVKVVKKSVVKVESVKYLLEYNGIENEVTIFDKEDGQHIKFMGSLIEAAQVHELLEALLKEEV
jgi:hypothetical protein